MNGEGTKTGYGLNRGNGTPPENQQPMDEKGRYSRHKNYDLYKSVVESVAGSVVSLYLGGYGVYEQSNPRNANAIEMSQKTITDAYEEIAKTGTPELIEAFSQLQGKFKIGLTSEKSASFALDSSIGNGMLGYIVLSPKMIENNGDKVHPLPWAISHETGHILDFFLGNGTDQPASAYVPAYEGQTLLYHACNELSTDECRQAFVDMVKEWESSRMSETQKEEMDALSDPEKMEDLLWKEWEQYVNQKLGITDASKKTDELDGQNSDLIQKYGMEFLKSERGQELKKLVDDARNLQEKKATEARSGTLNLQYEKFKTFGGLSDILMAAPQAPEKRGFQQENLAGVNVGHSRQYFSETSMCGTEIFADLCEIETFQPEILEFIKKWAPKTYQSFRMLLSMKKA